MKPILLAASMTLALSACGTMTSSDPCQAQASSGTANAYLDCQSSLDDKTDNAVEQRYRALGYPLR